MPRIAMIAGFGLLAACGPQDSVTGGTHPAAAVPSEGNPPSYTEPSLAAVIAQQIGEHWFVPEGLSTVPMRIKVDVTMLPDGRVLRAEVIAIDGDADDDSKRAMAEAAQGALHHFRDHPLVGLPLDDYDHWRHMILTFDSTLMQVE